jgi:hypothetical protein
VNGVGRTANDDPFFEVAAEWDTATDLVLDE